jgi:hypothetical protein
MVIMKFFKSIIQKFIREEKKVLGRWNMEYCDKKMNNKIDLSNEDHCGPCGQYILDKTKITNKNPDKPSDKPQNK